MMVKIKIFSLVLLLFTGVRAVPRQTITCSMELGPYTKYQSDPLVSYSINSTYTSEQMVYEIFRFGDQKNANQYTTTKAEHNVPAKGEYQGYISIPTELFLGDEGMSITVELYWSSGSIIRSNNCYIYPIVKETINPITYSGTYVCPRTHATITKSIVKYTDEEYTFTKIDDYFLTDTYYRLPIEQFALQTTLKESEFTYTSASLVIDGMMEYFPSLTYRRGIATIPLDVNYDNGLLTFSFQDILYAEPTLLMMSNTAKQGYRATRKFYLPTNHAKDLVGSPFRFVINRVGYNQSSFAWNTYLLSESPLIGDCQNSSYCVVGNISK